MISCCTKKRHCMNLGSMRRSWSGSLNSRKSAGNRTQSIIKPKSKIYRNRLGNTKKRRWIYRISFTSSNYNFNNRQRNRRPQNLSFLPSPRTKVQSQLSKIQTSLTTMTLVSITLVSCEKTLWKLSVRRKKNQCNESRTLKLSLKIWEGG